MQLTSHLRRLRLPLALAAGTLALAGAPAADAAGSCAQSLFGLTPINIAPSCFEAGDGNMTTGDSTDGTDWSSYLAPGATTLSDAFVTPDGTGGTDNTFVSGKKEEDPANWAFNESPSSPKDDLLAAAKADDSVTGHVFAYLGATRKGHTGSMDLSFEFNQESSPGTLAVPTTYTDAGGTHNTTTQMPGRQTGDLLIAFDTNGTAVDIGGCVWKGTATSGAWYLLPTGAGKVPAVPSDPTDPRVGTIALDSNQNPFNKACTPLDTTTTPAALGSVNADAITGANNVFDGTDLQADQFAEMSLDLTAVLTNPEVSSPCFDFGSVWMRTRSSNQVSSTPEDLVLPKPIHASSCTISGAKYDDANGNGTRDEGEAGLPGWKYELDQEINGVWTDTGKTAISGADGSYSFTGVNAGDYRVVELGHYENPSDATGTFIPYADGSFECTAPAETPAAGQDPRSCVSPTLTLSADSTNATQDFGNYQRPDFTVAKTQMVDGSGAPFTHDDQGDPLLAHVGDTIDYSILVSNTGHAALDFSATDPAGIEDGLCDTGTLAASDSSDDPVDWTSTTLAAGDAWTFTCSHLVLASDSILHNVFTGRGTDAGDTTLTRSDDVWAAVLKPHISVDKKVRVDSVGGFGDGPVTAYVGNTLQYQLVVTNDGGTADVPAPLTVSLTDAQCDAGTLAGPAGVTLGSSVLASGQSWTFTCSHVVTAGDGTAVKNVVSVTGVDQLGGPQGTVTASDEADATVVHPAVSIDKTGPATAVAGSLVPYTLVITNTGDESFTAPRTVVSDDRCEAPPSLVTVNGDTSPSSFDPGDRWTYTCSVQTTSTDTAVHNTGFVDALDTGGRHAKAQDAADTTLTPIAVLPETLKRASAKLRGPQGCISAKRASQVVVTGKRIASATFSVGGHKVKTLTHSASGRYVLKLSPKSVGYGSHLITVKIRFLPNSTLKSKTLHLRINRCRPVVVPAFTG